MPGFAKERSDIIILVLAAVSVIGTYSWRVSRWAAQIGTEGSAALRCIQGLAVLIAATTAFRIAATVPGSWESHLWGWKTLEWIFDPKFLGYLVVALPGCIVGTLVGSEPAGPGSGPQWPGRLIGIACFAVIPVTLIVLFQHANPMLAVGFGVAVVGLSLKYVTGPYRAILFWGLVWLILGCLLEPFEGGIKKDPYTLSYLFVTSGLASFGFVGFVQIPSKVFANVGQNPLLAYQAVTVLIPSLWPLVLVPLLKFLPQSGWPQSGWPGLLETFVKTFLLVALVAGFSRMRFTMRV
jgi:hypothetical protein